MDTTTDPNFEVNLAPAIEAIKVAEERALAGQLALEVMHEIKNPLEALGHLVYLAYQQADNPDKVRDYMQMAEEQLATAGRIAKQTLSLVRTTDTQQPVELAVLAEAALRIHQRTIKTKNLRLIKDLHQDAVAPVYEGEILQVISNLIVNSIDALSEDGVLRLRLRKRGNEVQLTIADNGRGIPAEHSDKIFKPFFTTKEGSGTGLGLALSKRIIDRHRGRIRMRSSIRPGKSGTTFRICLPVNSVLEKPSHRSTTN